MIRTRSRPDENLRKRIDADVRRLVATHTVAELPAAVLAELDAIRAHFAAGYVAT